MKRLFTLGLLLAATAAAAQEAPSQQTAPQRQQQPAQVSTVELAAKAEAAYRAENYQAYADYLQRIRQRQPYNGEVMYKLAGAYALMGEPEQAFTLLVHLQQQGLAFDPKGDEAFDSIKQYQLFGFLSEHLSKNAQPFDKAPVAFTLDETGLLPEGIAYSESQDAFFIGSVRQGGVWRTHAEGESELFIEPGSGGLKAVVDVAVDDTRDALWVAGSMVPQYRDFEAKARGEAALYRFNLESGELEGRYPVSGDKLPHVLGDIVIAPAGAVYVSDRISPLIFRLEPDGESLQPFIGSPKMTSLQGLALSPDGQYLFVADFTQGVFRIQTGTRQVVRIGHEPSINLGGIHDLAFYENSLVAIQSGTKPPRVVRYTLSENLAQVVKQQPLSANQSEYDELGQGVRVGEDFYFIANAQWSRYGAGGTVKSEAALEPVKVLKADLELGAKIRKHTGMKSVVPAKPDPDSK